jgi:hypothetical protein
MAVITAIIMTFVLVVTESLHDHSQFLSNRSKLLWCMNQSAILMFFIFYVIIKKRFYKKRESPFNPRYLFGKLEEDTASCTTTINSLDSLLASYFVPSILDRHVYHRLDFQAELWRRVVTRVSLYRHFPFGATPRQLSPCYFESHADHTAPIDAYSGLVVWPYRGNKLSTFAEDLLGSRLDLGAPNKVKDIVDLWGRFR